MKPADLANLSVLVVDDNAHHRAIVIEMLRAAGVGSIAEAGDGEQGLEELRRRRPKVVLVDWMMEPMDGLTFVQEVRRGGNLFMRATPIIMLTARNLLSDVETARHGGVDEYLIKPASPQSLLRKIEETLLRPRRFVDSPSYVGPCRRRKAASDYAGPQRRATDVAADAGLTFGERSLRLQALRAGVRKLIESARATTGDDARRVRAIYAAAEELSSGARELKDPEISRCARSLCHYLESLPRQAVMSENVLAAHIDALSQLVRGGEVDGEARLTLPEALERLVARRLRALAAQADAARAAS